ncbi:hypothetical protein IE53DRAFT_390342 [Violaceomyces palustris]|uniref:Uncharacterized protein n=1 Tax=Violaceomyces palustris TaxID=1673888 RepID=A0ACD0NNZ3_9BASI|nr:hypothetical protein IE53DRAFT_390342 [Violaceomyces palustris]
MDICLSVAARICLFVSLPLSPLSLTLNALARALFRDSQTPHDWIGGGRGGF